MAEFGCSPFHTARCNHPFTADSHSTGLNLSSGKATRILIVVLVLNLLFWMVVILWRVYILKRTRDQIRRQRRQAEAYSNPSLPGCEATTASREARDRPFVLATPRNELPPTYDEAIKYPSIDLSLSQGALSLGPFGQGALPERPARPPVPPRPSLQQPASTSVQMGSTADRTGTPPAENVQDDSLLPTYEELQRRAGPPNREIVLTVNSSHSRNQSA
ncbi:hypothetical protein ISCGN_003592 [Ixodes scapularis]